MPEQTVIGGDLAQAVRDLWAAYGKRGIEGMLALVPDDVEWAPIAGNGRTFHGSYEIRTFWLAQESDGKHENAVPHHYEQEGEAVLVSGSLRQFSTQGWSDTQPVWVFFFREGRLRRAQGFESRAAATEAIQAHNATR